MKINNSCGAVAVIFNPEDNPGVFQKDSSYILKRFELHGKECVLISEGNRVSLITDPEKMEEVEILSVILPDGSEDKIRSLVLKWYNNSLSLYADANPVKSKLILNPKLGIGYDYA